MSRIVLHLFLSRLDDGVARHYFGQLLDAIEHCHARGVCHRDIKVSNPRLSALQYFVRLRQRAYDNAGCWTPCKAEGIA